MRTVARTLPAAALAVAALATCAPDPSPVAGGAPSPATAPTTSSPTAAPSPEPSPGTTEAATAPSSRRSPVALSAADTDFADRPAPNGVDPERIRIPAIGVDADVADMGLNDDGSIEVPTEFADTGWWTYSPRPGRIGASAILGHVDSTTGPAVFYRLTDLQPGDEIHVDGVDGNTVTFTVRAIEQYPKAQFPSEQVFSATPTPTLRLITCGGAFDSNAGSYLDNIVVYADIVPA